MEIVGYCEISENILVVFEAKGVQPSCCTASGTGKRRSQEDDLTTISIVEA